MGRLTLLSYLRHQFSTLPSVSSFKGDLTGKTVVVVGANVGLGLEAARHFATMNPGRLILACRNLEKATSAVEDIRATTGCRTLEAWVVDLSDFKTVSAFADRYAKDGGDRLDLLVMNAGINTFNYRQTVDGWETTLQVNHLATALLTLLLLPYVKKSPGSSPTPRIVIVASEVHYLIPSMPEAESPSILEKLNDKEYCTSSVMAKRYFVSKLFNVFFVRSVASRLALQSSNGPSVTVTAVNPGWCKSQLFREAKHSVQGFFISLFATFIARTTEVGSRTLVWAAVGGSSEAVHGKYTASCDVEEESDFSLSDGGMEVQERLWKETIAVLAKVDTRVGAIVED